MAPANGVYQEYVNRLLINSNVPDLAHATIPIKAVLVKNSHTPNFDAHDFLNDIPSADRAKSTYKTITSPNVTKSDADDAVYFGDNITTVTFPTVTSGNVCSAIALFQSSGTTTTSPLICMCSFTASVTAGGGTVTITVNANGFMKASYQV